MAVAERIHSSTAKTARAVPANVVTITPKMAEEMLGKNVKNRRVSKRTVDAYARDIAAGNWRFTGEAIKLSRDGTMLDGQHRLLACIKAEQPFTTLVVYDLEDGAQDVMDTGRLRTFADALTIRGQAFATRMAATCTLMTRVKHGYSRACVTHAEQMAIIQRHPGLNDSAHIVEGCYGISPSMLACIHYIGAKLLDNSPFANEFVTVFVTGNSYDGCAAHAWRERVMRLKAAKTPITHQMMFNCSIHAWNLFAASKTAKFIRFQDSVEFDGLDLSVI